MFDPEDLIVRLFQAGCTACGEVSVVGVSHLCGSCGGPQADSERIFEAVGARRCAFKRALGQREQQLAGLRQAAFAKQPTTLSDSEHFTQVITPAAEHMQAIEAEVACLLSSGSWDPGDADVRAAFSRLLGALDSGLALISDLQAATPPSGCRAVHRDLTRLAIAHLGGLVAASTILAAPSELRARSALQRCQDGFALALKYGSRFATALRAMTEISDAVFRPDGSVNMAAASRIGLGSQPMSIVEATVLVRNALDGVPGMADAAEEYVLPFLPLLTVGALVFDVEVIAAHARRLRDVLDAADAAATWVADANLLVARIARAGERMADHGERLVRAGLHGLPRADVLRLQTEVYLGHVEGALRDLGSIVLIALRAGCGKADGRYEADVVDGVKAGEVMSALLHLGSPCGDAVP